jgi:hypothetical protein
MLKSTSGVNPMLARLTAKAESHVPRTVETASLASASSSRVTPEQLVEINRKIESLEKTKAEQDRLIKTLCEHSESQDKSYQESLDLHRTALVELEKQLAAEKSRSSEAVISVSSELTSAIDDKSAELRKIIDEQHKSTQLKFDYVASEISSTTKEQSSKIKAQMQSMFDSVMTAMGESLLSQNSTASKIEELMNAYIENREVDPRRIESETIAKNINTTIEQSILAREAHFPETANVFLQLGLEIASAANDEKSKKQITELMGTLKPDMGSDL